MHDIGKKTELFKAYIQSESKIRGSVQHAAGGAIAIKQVKGNPLIIHLIGLIVLGHHSGLTNMNQLDSKLVGAPKELRDIELLARQEQKQAEDVLRKSEKSLQFFDQLKDRNASCMYISTLTRMCFSSVVDADWLDTEAYFNKNKTNLRKYELPDFLMFLARLNHHMENKLPRNSKNTNVINLREHVFNAASQSAYLNHNFFSLHAPTGSGKTLASLSFALNHTQSHKVSRHIKRIIFALPLTNLTEQTSAIYRDILGSEHVIEHHSQMDLDDLSEDMNRKKLATENYDRPFIVTTTIQLFESLFSNRPNKVRKLHNIANSIIILDEYQKLPLHVLKPILFLLKTLREHFGVTVLLMSATPIALEESKSLDGVGNPIEILSDYEKLFVNSQRVEYKKVDQALEPVELISKMKDYESVLCIVNTRKDAQRLFKVLQEQNDRWEKIFHLSKTMCSDHLLEVMKEIKASNKKSIAVISTSLIEAGSDLDFNAVFRMYAPLDSIIQSAGRCNREGNVDKGIVYLFDLKNAVPSSPEYEQSTLVTKNFLKEAGISALYNPKEFIRYFRRIYSYTGENALDKHQLYGGKLLQFKNVAETFKLIENAKSVLVICANYKNFPRQELEYLASSRQWFRKMQRFTIPLDKKVVNHRNLQKLNELYVWEGEYDPEFGFIL